MTIDGKFCFPIKHQCLAMLLFLLCSCSTPIKEVNRDKTSTYRGYWIATFLNAPDNQATQSVSCLNLSGTGSLQIAGGRVVARVHKFDLGGFVDKNGKFSAEVPLLKRSRVASRDDGLLGEKKFVIRGQLDAGSGAGTGLLTVGYEDFGFRGCVSKVDLIKSEIPG